MLFVKINKKKLSKEKKKRIDCPDKPGNDRLGDFGKICIKNYFMNPAIKS
jgi:hypothetical protein